jgi:Fe-S oxidoreductase
MTNEADREQFRADLGLIQKHVLRCIRCGYCNVVCPTSNVTSSFRDSRTSRGRMILIQSIVQGVGNIEPYSPSFKELIDLCYSCRRCTEVCPAGIPIPDLNSYTRYAYLRRRGSTALSLGHRIFSNYGTFDRFASYFAPVTNWALRRSIARKVMEWTTHIDARAHLPRFHTQSFNSWFNKHHNTTGSKKIVYFVDSYANYNAPAFGKMVVAALENLGYQVIVPPQKEAGMPAVEYGMLSKARKLAKYNLEHLAPYAREGTRILCTSLAAAYLLKDGYSSFMEDANLPVVAKAVTDLQELLHEEYEAGNLHFDAEPKQNVLYHVCCLSRTLGLAPVTTSLLRAAGMESEVIEECCGGAGVWGTFKENYQISSEIAAKLCKRVDPEVTVLTESETCKLQIEAHVRTTVRFPLEVLAPRIRGIRQYWLE